MFKYLICVILLLGVCPAGAQLIEMLKPLDDSPNQQHSTRRPLVPSNTKPTPTAKFQHEFQLDPDGNFWLFWNISGKNMTFETHVRTRGYIGFGLSPNGKMFPSDVVVGWVRNDGSVHFKDCHTVGHYAPVVDTKQDWHLLKGMENDFGTVLTFTRKLDTCDDEDMVITDNTIKAIYSYHPEDPDSIQGMQWHGVKRRGAQSLMFLSSTKTDVKIPSDSIKINLVSPNFHIPTADTRYQCTIHKMPPLTKKHHMIRYEPLIQKKSIEHVHHIVVYTCPNLTDADVGASFECYTSKTPRRYMMCSEVVLAWAVGGVAYNLPEHVGFPFGGSGNPQYLRLEMHYNNPTLKSDVFDSSGITLILSPHVRQYDAGGLSIGISTKNTHFIPPYQKNFLSTGFCHSSCTDKGIPDTGIKIFGLLQHAHLLGAGLKTRHIRNNIELPPIAEDDHYDFDYQDIRVLKEERLVSRGDSILVECTYDSTRKNKPTVGGLSTQQEMCISFMYYYPRIDMSYCVSIPMYYETHNSTFEATKQFYTWNWQDTNVQKRFQNVVNNSTHKANCDGPHFKQYQYFSKVPEPQSPYKKPDRHCY